MYLSALEELEPDERRVVSAALAGWATDRDCSQVGRNIAAETALALGDFVALLKRFAAELAASRGPVEAWQTACRRQKFKGRRLGSEDCPGVLGRATSVEALAISIKETFPQFTRRQAERLLYRIDGATWPGEADKTYLRGTPLGRYLIWATFNPEERAANPFDRLPQTRRAICTALGLGHFRPEESLATLAWDHETSGSPPLHRPTVADAEDYPFFRPHRDPDAAWGETEPLPPNEEGIEPQPELVMPVVLGRGLKFPIRIF
jgi:hypothetical protein